MSLRRENVGPLAFVSNDSCIMLFTKLPPVPGCYSLENKHPIIQAQRVGSLVEMNRAGLSHPRASGLAVLPFRLLNKFASWLTIILGSAC